MNVLMQTATGLALTVLASAAGYSATMQDTVDDLAESWLGEAGVAGMTIGVEHRGERYVQGYGYADLEHEVPMTADMLLRIGSVTKTFTAAAIMQLEEAGELKLTDSITKYLPDYPTHGETITLWNLLTHTAGIPNYTDFCNRRLDYSHEELLNVFKNRPLEFEPGAGWNYSNSGYYLLGLVIEQASGRTYADYIEEAICKPAGLSDTRYGYTGPIMKGRSHGYLREDEAFRNADFVSMTGPYSAGGLCSTAEDLLKFRTALGDGTLLPRAKFARMIAEQEFPNGDPLYYSLGLFISELDGHPKACHEGGIDGFVSQFAYYPEDDLTIVILQNTEGGEAPRLERRIARAVLGLPEPQFAAQPLAASEARTWAGKYGLGSRIVDVTERDGELLVKIEGLMPFNLPLLHQGDGFFVLKGDPDVRLQFQEAESETGSLLLRFGDIRVHLNKVQ